MLQRPVLFVMGPTASGKTALALQLAQRFPFEIVSVDSAQVYRGMDIGTAKPDAQTLRRFPHRLLNLLDPAQAYSAGQFRRDALQEIRTIYAAGRWPLLVGGTMLYVRALQHGLAPLPPAVASIRERLAAERAQLGARALHQRLAQVDAQAAQRIHPNDSQRIQRALEVYALSGQSLSDVWQSAAPAPLPFRIVKLILAPPQRHNLQQRIAQRFQQMLEQGLVAEVAALHARHDLDLDKPALRAVGYRQVWEYLAGNYDYPTMQERGIVATRQLAKRQMTWLRSEADAMWIDSCAAHRLELALDGLRQAGFFASAGD